MGVTISAQELFFSSFIVPVPLGVMANLNSSSSADRVEKRIYIGGLHESVTEDLLVDRFSKFGTVIEASTGKGSEGQCRGFGHMTISTTSKQWQTCLSTYNGAKWKGKVMRLEEARPDHMERRRMEQEEYEKKAEKQRKRRLRWNDSDGFLAKDMTPVTDANMKTRKGWKRGRYGRAISVMRLQKEDGTRFVFDPTHYKNNLTKLYNIDAKMKPVRMLPMIYDEFSDSDDDFITQPNEYQVSDQKVTDEYNMSSVEFLDEMEDIHQSAKEKGDERRLAALERWDQEQKAKREIIQQSFAAMEKEERQNHVTFEDSDHDDETAATDADNSIADNAAKPTGVSKWLFDSESEDDADLEIKINPVLEGEKGRERLALQSGYKGDDRFKLGEDFMDEDEYEDDDRKVDMDDIGKALGAEKDQSMDILKTMFGDQGVVKKKPEVQWASGARFDPDAENASDFVLTSHKTACSDNESRSDEDEDEEEESWLSKPARPESAMPEVSTEKHYEVNVNMKPLFGGEAGQPFKLFGGDDSDNDIDNIKSENREDKKVEAVGFGSQNKEALGVFFFFHVDDPGLLKSYDPSGVFQQQDDR
ncbi:hypothetical protein EC973_004446 [Apophysomyces ossiformis]|uniref:RRM domain-containing protein n=1 Tax=Apophysomyces ossiformis TaxID=679940 RepID=A0A8H7BWX2_9FUNG|nr:hypothetical protein EC973_004446 [Apophysomyces ossiformis]